MILLLLDDNNYVKKLMIEEKFKSLIMNRYLK